MGRLDGKIAIVTGAAQGLGKADAIMMASRGAQVLLSDINVEAGETVAQTIRDGGGDAQFIRQDVTSESDWAQAFDHCEKSFGPANVLVNNAGMVIIGTPEDTTLDHFRKQNAIMTEGVFIGCQTAIARMKEHGGGSIINMSSVASHLGYPVFFAYSAAKGAVRSMTKSIAVHCQMNGYGIRCNSIHAGAIDTPMVVNASKSLGLDDASQSVPETIGLGQPEDVANMVVYLASDESRFVNGAELVIDNALTIQ